MSDRSLQIQEAAGVAPWPLLHCPDCLNTMATSYEQDFHFAWSIKLKCPTCGLSWWVCTKCDSLRTHLKTSAQATRHNRMKHKKHPVTTTTAAALPIAALATTTESKVSEEIEDTYFGRKESITYFEACRSGNGICQLVGRAVFKDNCIYQHIHQEDVDMYMSMAHFVSKISRNQREDFADFLHRMTKSTARQHSESSPLFRFKTEDDSSLATAIPIPTTKTTVEKPAL